MTSPTSQASVATMSEAKLGRPRVALICDFVEENWPSMDLVADMLFGHLEREHASTLQVARICPPLQLTPRPDPGYREGASAA